MRLVDSPLHLINTMASVKELQEEIRELEWELSRKREEQRRMKRKMQEEHAEVLKDYDARVKKLGYQGGKGHRMTLDGHTYWLASHVHHFVIREGNREKALPTEAEQQAFIAVHGVPMRIAKEVSSETWGN